MLYVMDCHQASMFTLSECKRIIQVEVEKQHLAKKLQKFNRLCTSYGTHRTCSIWKCILRGFSPQISTDFNTNLKRLEKVVSQEGLTRKLSVRRQKDESQNGCFKKTKHAKFSEKRTFLTLVILEEVEANWFV